MKSQNTAFVRTFSRNVVVFKLGNCAYNERRQRRRALSNDGIGGFRMQIRLRQVIAALALSAGLLVTPVAHVLPVAAQDNPERGIALDIFRCPPGVTLQQMVTKDCIQITSGVDVTLTSINGKIAPLTIADATLDGNTFRWSTTGSGSTTDEWGFTHGTLPTGTTAFLLQGNGVVSGQSGTFDYRFTTSASTPSAFLDMYLLMAADAPIIEPPAATSSAPAEPTAGLRPSPTATSTPATSSSSSAVAPAAQTAFAGPVEAASAPEPVAPASTGDVFVAGDEVVVFEGPVNLRSSAGTSASAIAALDEGVALTVVSGPTEASGYNWYEVKTDTGQTGWVAVDFIQLAPGPNGHFAAGDQVVVFDGPVNLRSAAGTSATVLQSLEQDTLLTVVSGPTANGGYAWYEVETANSVSGWVAADFIELVAKSTSGSLAVGDRVEVVDGPVNLRSAAGTGNAVVTVLQTGDTLALTDGPSSSDGYTWYAATTSSGSAGWVASDFLKKLGFASGDVVTVTSDALNVRDAAGLDSSVVGTVHQGTTAVIKGGPTTADNRDWYQIDVSGVTSGWAAAEYLALSSASPVTPQDGAFGAGDWIFVTDPPLNLRDTPSTSGQILASLGDGDGLLVQSDATQADGYTWNQVEHDGVTGYVATDYVSGGFALGEAAVVVDGPVNLRSAAGTGNSIVTSLAQGAQVTVLSVDPQVIGGVYWFQVTTTDSVTGWVAGRYLGPVSA